MRDPRVPADCAAIYTTDWSGEFEPDYVLNPEWSIAEGAPEAARLLPLARSALSAARGG